ncbi:MAG: hypothetical protein K6G12_02585 [Lachnospiraceae bacterium]|nr:hypothetical protein [Lachnospiraceae bacterium]
MVVDDLKRQQKEREKNIIKRRNDPDEEETYMYDVRKPMEFINESEHGVFDITRQTGINTAKSVFDRDAHFRTT